MRHEYWDGLAKILDGERQNFPYIKRTEQGRYLNHKFLGTAFEIVAGRFIAKNMIRAEIYLFDELAPHLFIELIEKKESYNVKFGNEIVFPDNFQDGSQARNIYVELNCVNVKDRRTWDQQHIWFAENMIKLYGVFGEDIEKFYRSRGR